MSPFYNGSINKISLYDSGKIMYIWYKEIKNIEVYFYLGLVIYSMFYSITLL